MIILLNIQIASCKGRLIRNEKSMTRNMKGSRGGGGGVAGEGKGNGMEGEECGRAVGGEGRERKDGDWRWNWERE